MRVSLDGSKLHSAAAFVRGVPALHSLSARVLDVIFPQMVSAVVLTRLHWCLTDSCAVKQYCVIC